jgi:hypothetical protein
VAATPVECRPGDRQDADFQMMSRAARALDSNAYAANTVAVFPRAAVRPTRLMICACRPCKCSGPDESGAGVSQSINIWYGCVWLLRATAEMASQQHARAVRRGEMLPRVWPRPGQARPVSLAGPPRQVLMSLAVHAHGPQTMGPTSSTYGTRQVKECTLVHQHKANQWIRGRHAFE